MTPETRQNRDYDIEDDRRITRWPQIVSIPLTNVAPAQPEPTYQPQQTYQPYANQTIPLSFYKPQKSRGVRNVLYGALVLALVATVISLAVSYVKMKSPREMEMGTGTGTGTGTGANVTVTVISTTTVRVSVSEVVTSTVEGSGGTNMSMSKGKTCSETETHPLFRPKRTGIRVVRLRDGNCHNVDN